MEVQDAERIVIAKPVASKPSSSSLKSFSALLSDAISPSSPSTFSETAVVAIRPKTVRFKPAANQASVAAVASEDRPSKAAAHYSCEKNSNPEIKSSVVYKPLAKLVSRKTAHLLANLGNFDLSHEQAIEHLPTEVQPSYQDNHYPENQLTAKIYQKLPSQVKRKLTDDSSKVVSENLEENQKASADRPSYDGYNWRKYGQKQVKGSEYPRSYYKCTHPNCPVKKKVETSLEGLIAEIVYKGEHNHRKPQPPKRLSSGLQEQGFVTGNAQEMRNPLWSSHLKERNEVSEGRTENQNEAGLSVIPSYLEKNFYPYDSVLIGSFNSGVRTTDTSCALSGDCDEGSRAAGREDHEPKSKRRKNGHQSIEVGIIEKGAQAPRVVVQKSPDSEIVGDGFRWRKYGQKVVKGNPYPRSYYRCTNVKCNVRKHVERSLDDPTAFITTYEGKHNHEMPATRNLNPVLSYPDLAAPAIQASYD